MPRRYYKRTRTSRKKYSIQQKAFLFSAAASTTTAVEIVPATSVEGMRKVKHVTVSLTTQSEWPIYWALVYVPQGTTPSALNVATTADETSFYEPNQFVMNCGISDPSAGPVRVWSPLARNLNDGDRIVLLVNHFGGTAPLNLNALARYAITY